MSYRVLYQRSIRLWCSNAMLCYKKLFTVLLRLRESARVSRKLCVELRSKIADWIRMRRFQHGMEWGLESDIEANGADHNLRIVFALLVQQYQRTKPSSHKLYPSHTRLRQQRKRDWSLALRIFRRANPVLAWIHPYHFVHKQNKGLFRIDRLRSHCSRNSLSQWSQAPRYPGQNAIGLSTLPRPDHQCFQTLMNDHHDKATQPSSFEKP